MRMIVMLLGLCLPLSAAGSAENKVKTAEFRGPAFADGPYNTVIGALGSGDKALISQEGVLTRLYASDGAQGMGRHADLIGESIRVSRTNAASLLKSVQVEYDEHTPSAPVALATRKYRDNLTVEVRALQVDEGQGKSSEASSDRGYVINVTALNVGDMSVDIELVAAVDWLPSLTARPPTAIAASAGKPVICGASGGWAVTPGSSTGRLSADGFRPGRNTEQQPGHTPTWADTWALGGNYPGQNGNVGRKVGILRYVFAGLPHNTDVYLAVAPAIMSASGLPVEAGQNTSFVSGGNGSAVFYIATQTDAEGKLQVAMGNVKSAPKGWKGEVAASGLWVYQRTKSVDRLVAQTPVDELQQHTCDPNTGFDSKNGQCLRVLPCSDAPGQQFERYACEHWRAVTSPSLAHKGTAEDIPLPADAECLSHRLAGGRRRWLNAELWGPATCQTENGPLISYSTFVWPVFGGPVCGRNQFFAFIPTSSRISTAGTIRNNITDKCLTHDTGTGLGSLEPCQRLAERQKWMYPAMNTTGPIKLLMPNEEPSNLCLDATAPPPAPAPGSIHPGRPNDAAGTPLAFVNIGSEDDLPADNPVLRLNFTLAPGMTTSHLLYLPPGNSTGPVVSCSSVDPATLWKATVATWKERVTKWGTISVPDHKLQRASEIAKQTLLMMTENQHDGLRALKSPIHYYGSDPYDTFRITRAMMRWGRLDLSEAILTRQLGRRCKEGHGTWEMWEIDGPQDCGAQNVTPLFIVQGLASNALLDQWKFMQAGSGVAKSWLEKIWPALDGTANATQGQRELCGEGCAGLLPESGGDGGLPHGHIFVQEAGALFGVADAATAAKALGYQAAATRHSAVFNEFRAALLHNVSANTVKLSAVYPSVVGMYPGFNVEEAKGCCAWGGVDIIYPFALVNASSQTAVSSMDFWSSPSRTDKFGLHLKLGYSEKVWAYLSADLGHIHIIQGNYSGAMRVLKAMIDNASPTVGTYEEFETGPWNGNTAAPKRSWGGIPDMWFTSEVLNLLRDVVLHEDEASGSLLLYHGVPDEWRQDEALSIQHMPTSFGVTLDVATQWNSSRSRLTFQLRSASMDRKGMYYADQKLSSSANAQEELHLNQLHVHVGSCVEAIVTSSTVESSGVELADMVVARCQSETVVVVHHRLFAGQTMAMELEVVH